MIHLLRAPVFALALFAALAALEEFPYPVTVVVADAALHPWSTNTHPTDVAKSHVEEITSLTGVTHEYTVFQDGTMDGRNCRSPMGCGIAREGALLQTWESNRSVRMENVGDTDADKAFALWF